jgi:Siphovirus Gp157
MARNLFDISDDLLKVEEAITEAGGDISENETLEAWFDQLGEERDRKVLGYCKLIANLEAHADSCEVEIKAMQSIQRANENAAKRLKERLKEFFLFHGIKKLDLGIFRPNVRGNGGKPPLIVPEAWEREPAQAPEKYHRILVELQKDLIREDCAQGAAPEGCYIAEAGTHLRLR